MKKIIATTIQITRATGPTGLCGTTMAYTSWEEANDTIDYMTDTVNYCDDVDFAVQFEDGTWYEGSMEIYRDKSVSLTDHIRQHLSFYAGMNRPAHFTEVQYQEHLNAVKPEMLEECSNFIAKYAIG